LPPNADPAADTPPTPGEFTFSFDIPARGNAGSAARRRLDSVADRLDRATMARVRLLVSELVNRSAVEPECSVVRVSLVSSPALVRCTVTADPDDDSRASPARGLDWALFLVSRMAHRWGNGNDVWFEIERQGRFPRPMRD
jgi:hypothetical protein